jgi:glycosyltransferase involved in cell wall biosynthesis
MKVLHIGHGFNPIQQGGLIRYTEDLLAYQSSSGYDVAYCFAGRRYPLLERPRLRRWHRGAVGMYEIINSRILLNFDKGTLTPEKDFSEPATEGLLRGVLRDFSPDIVHIHQLLCLPSSVINLAKTESKIPVVMTLQDYFPLCPTVKLFDHTQHNCLKKNVGPICRVCCQHATDQQDYTRTLKYDLRKLPKFLRKGVVSYFKPAQKIKPIDQLELSDGFSGDGGRAQNTAAAAAVYQKRREINAGRLRSVDLLIAMSSRVEEIYSGLAGCCDNIITLALTLNHIHSLTYRRKAFISSPVRFATLDGAASRQKGAFVLNETLQILAAEDLGAKFEFHIFGGMEKTLLDVFAGHGNVFWHGKYDSKDLDRILADIDVGIVPSIWEEAYGYVGIEFMAKGIPVIGNRRGGIPDYTIEGKTGWVNRSASPEELAGIIREVVLNPDLIKMLNHRICDNRDLIIKSFTAHGSEIHRIYEQVCGR